MPQAWSRIQNSHWYTFVNALLSLHREPTTTQYPRHQTAADPNDPEMTCSLQMVADPLLWKHYRDIVGVSEVFVTYRLTHTIVLPIILAKITIGWVLVPIILVGISIQYHWIWTLGCYMGAHDWCYGEVSNRLRNNLWAALFLSLIYKQIFSIAVKFEMKAEGSMAD